MAVVFKKNPPVQALPAVPPATPLAALVESVSKEEAKKPKLLESIKKSSTETSSLWHQPDSYNILDALKDYGSGNWHGKELHLIGKNGGSTWKVKGYDSASCRASLTNLGQKEQDIKPAIGKREIPLYSPHWID